MKNKAAHPYVYTNKKNLYVDLKTSHRMVQIMIDKGEILVEQIRNLKVYTYLPGRIKYLSEGYEMPEKIKTSKSL